MLHIPTIEEDYEYRMEKFVIRYDELQGLDPE